MTPKARWRKQTLAVDYFRIFGCIAYAHVPDQKRKKLVDKGVKCVFIGISDQSKAYKLYDPITKKIIISRNVIFDEEQFWPWSEEGAERQILINFEDDEEPTTSRTTIEGSQSQNTTEENGE